MVQDGMAGRRVQTHRFAFPCSANSPGLDDIVRRVTTHRHRLALASTAPCVFLQANAVPPWRCLVLALNLRQTTHGLIGPLRTDPSRPDEPCRQRARTASCAIAMRVTARAAPPAADRGVATDVTAATANG